MTLRDYARVVDRRKWVVIAAVMLTTLAAVALTTLQTPIYSASSEVLVQPRGQDGLFENQIVNLNDRAIQTEIQVIEGQAVQQRVQDDLGLAEEPPEANASAVGDTDVISITVRDASAANAATYADAYAAAYIDVRREQAVDGTAHGECRSADRHRRPAGRTRCAGRGRPASQRARRAALQLQHHARPTPCRRRTAHRWRSDHQVGRSADDAGRADADSDRRARRSRRAADRARRCIPARLPRRQGAVGGRPRDDSPTNRCWPSCPSTRHPTTDRSRSADPPTKRSRRTVGCAPTCSSSGSTGRSTSSSSPARWRGRARPPPRRTSQSCSPRPVTEWRSSTPTSGDRGCTRCSAFRRSPGFTDLLLGAEAKHIVSHIDIDGGNRLSVYPSGAVPSNPSELLSGRRTSKLLAEMGDHYDVVIVDSAPVLPVSDSVALAGAVDGVIVVAHAGRVTGGNVVETLERLGRVSAPILGLVLNQASQVDHRRATPTAATAPPRPRVGRHHLRERATGRSGRTGAVRRPRRADSVDGRFAQGLEADAPVAQVADSGEQTTSRS